MLKTELELLVEEQKKKIEALKLELAHKEKIDKKRDEILELEIAIPEIIDLEFVKEDRRVFAVVNGVKIEDKVIYQIEHILKQGV